VDTYVIISIHVLACFYPLPIHILPSKFVMIWFQPPKVKSFIEKVIQCPLQDIAIPLSGFRWEYDKVILLYSFAVSSNFFNFHHALYVAFHIRGIFITGDHCYFILIHTSRLFCHVEMT
jgi:hypothetical protein